jgi:hypothetical protein
MHLDTEDLTQRMLNLSDDELLSIVTTHRTEYRQVAIDLASKELMQRNVPLPAINYPQLNAAPQPGRSLVRDYMKSKPGRVLTTVYLLLAGGALFPIVAFSDDVSVSGNWSSYGLGAIWLLTLPWSMALLPFAWALAHNTGSPIFVSFFALCAGLNALLINRVAGAVTRGADYK